MAKKISQGGPATIAGVYYQMLMSLLEVAELEVSFPATDDTVQWTVEPSNGGDLERVSSAGRTVYQAKTRSTGAKWSLAELVVDVFPDLLRAEPEKSTQYVFVTDWKIGKIEPLETLGSYLSGKDSMQSRASLGPGTAEPIWDLGISDLQSQAPKAAGQKSSKAKGRKTKSKSSQDQRPKHTASDFLDRIVEVLLHKMTGPSYPSFSSATLRAQVEILLQNFTAREITVSSLEEDLLEILDEVGFHRESRRDFLNQIVGDLMRRARAGSLQIGRKEFFNDCAIPLSSWGEIRARSLVLSKSLLSSLAYEKDVDVRADGVAVEQVINSSAMALGHIALMGSSGYGKTWAALAVISRLANLHLQPVAIWVEQTGDFDSDLQKAAQVFCIDIWQIDEVHDFWAICRKVSVIAKPKREEPWLMLFIDGITDADYVPALQAARLKEKGVSLIVTTSVEPGVNWSYCRHSIGLFTRSQVVQFLESQLGKRLRIPPPDVVDLLRVPLLAGVYVELAKGETDWDPKNEYELIGGHWNAKVPDAFLPSLQNLSILAGQLLDYKELDGKVLVGTPYPWTTRQVSAAGISELALNHFLSIGLMVLSGDRKTCHLWHDRILEWGIAEGLVLAWEEEKCSGPEDALASLQSKVKNADSPPSGKKRYGYVLHDVLWILLRESDESRIRAAVDLLRTNFQADTDMPRFPPGSIGSLGERVIPAMVAWIERSPASAFGTGMLASGIGEAASRISSVKVREAALRAIRSVNPNLQVFGLEVLSRQLYGLAFEQLVKLKIEIAAELELALDSDENVSVPRGRVLRMREEVRDSLILAAAARSDTLESLILAPGQDDFLSVILPIIPWLPTGSNLWAKCAEHILGKAEALKLVRGAAFCIYCFQDRSDLAHEWLVRNSDRVGGHAEGAMARLALWQCFREVLPYPELEDRQAYGVWALSSWWTVRVFFEDSGKFSDITDRILLLMNYQRGFAQEPLATVGLEGALVVGWMAEISGELETHSGLIKSNSPLPNRYISMDQLEGRLGAHVLRLLWSDSGGNLEVALVDYLVSLGPNDHRGIGQEDKALGLILSIGGWGMDRIADAYLRSSSDYYCLLRVFSVLERSCTYENALHLKELVEGYELPSDSIEYIPARAVLILAQHGYWELAVAGLMRMGLKNLREVEFVAGQPWPDQALTSVLEELQNEATAGALLALGLSRRAEYSHMAREAVSTEADPTGVVEAAWLALDLLDDNSEETLGMAIKALGMGQAEKYRGLHNLANRHGWWEKLPAGALDLDAEERLVGNLGLEAKDCLAVRRYLDFRRWTGNSKYTHSSIEEFVSLLWDDAVSPKETIFSNYRVEAIKALAAVAPAQTMLACREGLASLKQAERLLIPRIMMGVDKVAALAEFRQLLAEELDWRVVLAVGEVLAPLGEEGVAIVLSWLRDDDPLLREGAAFCSRAFLWHPELEQQLRKGLDDADWHVRDPAEKSLLQLLKNREVLGLRKLIEEQDTLARKWAAMEAAIDLGYPGISGMLPPWYRPLVQGMPRLACQFAKKKVEELSKKLSKYWADKKRDHTRIVLRRMGFGRSSLEG